MIPRIRITKVSKIRKYLDNGIYPWMVSKYSIAPLSEKKRKRIRKYVNQIHNMDCLELLRRLPSNSLDSLVTDPPSGISFLNKSWDSFNNRKDFIQYLTNILSECYRVLKPGAYGVVWSLPRTSHWTGTACEKAGFEVRDCIYHIFGQGFPKSMRLGNAMAQGPKEFWNGWGTSLKPAIECWWLQRKPQSES
jgi:site-specific DNA-methyltransferase (adenine-specific)